MFQVGDKVWHNNQLYYDQVIVKPFTVRHKFEYSDGTIDYVIRLGQVNMLANEKHLTKVVK